MSGVAPVAFAHDRCASRSLRQLSVCRVILAALVFVLAVGIVRGER
ncbi:hypothetical protein [Streptomyces tubercidicus]